MAAIKQTEEAPDNQGAEAKRERSTIEFPYQDLDEAVTVAKGVHAIGGTSCQWDQLAAHFNQAANGGGFRLRLLTARMFGVLTYDKGTVTLTPLGTRIADDRQEATARSDAFLNVPLYKAVYEQFKGSTLPPPAGLEGAMVTLGVAPKQKDKARQVFQRSAQQAGFFSFGANRLVMPTIKGSAGTREAPEKEKPRDGSDGDEKEKPEKPAKKYPPFIEGLLEKLPPAETQWSVESRKKWLQTAANIFDLMYSADGEEAGELSITVNKDSAK
jgi:hypothetical protein